MRLPALVLTATLLAFAGCTLNTDYFSEYRGKNLLSNYDFDSTGNWQTTTYGLIAAAPTTDYYMLWENVGAAAHSEDLMVPIVPTTDGSGHTVYRLEIKNLLPDGDFEAEAEGLPTLTGTGWVLGGTLGTLVRYSAAHTTNSAPTSPITYTPSAMTIDNRSLLMANQNTGDFLTVSLDTAVGSTLWRAGQYRIRFDARNASSGLNFNAYLKGASAQSGFDAQSGGIWQISFGAISTSTTAPAGSLSQTFTLGSSLPSLNLQLGSSTEAQIALIDNLRLFLTDQELSVQASLPSLSSGSLKLLPGTKSGAYTFTVNVRDDPTADQTNGNHVGNRFEPSGLTVVVEGKAKNSSTMATLAKEFFARPSGGWTSFTTLSVNGGLDFVDLDADLEGNPALRVRLSPTNGVDLSNSGKDVGSLLIAHPVLTYNP